MLLAYNVLCSFSDILRLSLYDSSISVSNIVVLSIYGF